MRSTRRKWEEQVEQICARLGRYCVADINRELRAKARVNDRRSAVGSSGNIHVGFYLPSNREIDHLIATAEWSVEVTKGDKHRQTVYEYRGGERREGEPPANA